MSAVATYLYAVLAHAGPRAPRLAGVRGLPGTGPVRAVAAGRGLWLVVADAPLGRYGAAPIERRLGDLGWVSTCALAHEAVVERCARLGPLVPAKLFTLFRSDASALAHVRRRRAAIGRLLRRVAGRQEWAVRLLLEPARAPATATRDGAVRARTGTAFLLAKRAARERARTRVDAARREAARAYAALARAADAAHREPVPAAARELVLDAAFLVPARRARRFRAAARALARRLAARGLRLTLTGPWPPYTFVAGPV